MISRGLRQPHLAPAAKDLPNVTGVAGQIKHFKCFTLRFDPKHRVSAKVTELYNVILVHIHRIGSWPSAWKLPFAPWAGGGVIYGQLTSVPLA